MAGTISNLSLPNAQQCLEFNKNLLSACVDLSVKHILWFSALEKLGTYNFNPENHQSPE